MTRYSLLLAVIGGCCAVPAALAQGQSPTKTVYSIGTVAGVGVQPFTGEGKSAVGQLLFSPQGIALDKNGLVYFSDTYYQRIFKVAADGSISTFAGTGTQGFGGDGGPATAAKLYTPLGLTFDSAGNLYVADAGNYRIRKITPAGVISTVAGNGTYGYSGDGGPATAAQLNYVGDLRLDAAGNLYLADQVNYRIRKVDTNGVITTVAGNGQPGYSGDGGSAKSAKIIVTNLTLDAAGNIYFSDDQNFVVRKVSAADGTVSTVAGTGTSGYSGDTGKATLAQLSNPVGLALDAAGNLYIADSIVGRVRMVSPTGIITTLAGSGVVTLDGGDGRAAITANLIIPRLIAIDAAQNVFLTESEGRRVRRIDAKTTVITRVAGVDITGAILGDGATATQASLYDPEGVALDAQGNLFIADRLDFRVRKVSGGVISTAAGTGLIGGAGNGGQASQAQLNNPADPIFDANGNLYFYGSYQVRTVNTQGVISAYAGTGSEGYAGDNGLATKAQIFGGPIAVDAAGNLYIADTTNNRIRKVTQGIITTIGGTGQLGYSGDGGPAVSAQIYNPSGIAVDAAGNVYFSDYGNNRVRRIATNGIITTFAGNGLQQVSGDGGSALQASVPGPASMAVDAAGNVYICTSARIRRVDSSGVIQTIAGTGTQGYSGDGGPATSALLDTPTGLAFDAAGAIYFGDSSNQVVRKLTPANFFSNGVVNGASMISGAVAPGEIITIFGNSIGPAQLTLSGLNAAGQMATTVGATQVLFDGRAAPVIYSSSGQVSAIVPYEVAGQSQTQAQIMYQGQPTNTVTLNVTDASPALFTSNSSGTGQAAVLNQDGSINSASNPAAAGSIVVLYGTGEGQTNPGGTDGQFANSTYPAPIDAVSVTVAGKAAKVLYFGAAPGEVAGLFQANVQLPAGVTGNAVAVTVSVGTHTSPAVSVAVH